MDSFTTLKVVVHEDGYAIVELARPSKSNAMSVEMWEELPQAFAMLDERDDVRAVVIRGQGRNFCAGIDFTALALTGQMMQEDCAGRAREKLRRHILNWQSSLSSIEKCRWPVLAAVHGACIGAGVDLITACDIRYCSADAAFCVKEVDLAIVADMGTLQRLPSIVGHGVARDLALTARTVRAEEALRVNLVSAQFPDAQQLHVEVEKLAKQLAAKSPLAMTGTKRVLLYQRDHTVADGLDYVATWNSAQLISDDLQEVFKAVIGERRAPTFSKM